MADDKIEPREFNFRQAFPWTELFQSFRLALDPKKLLLAAGGILAMSLGWWLLAWAAFGMQSKPKWDSAYDETKLTKEGVEPEIAEQRMWERFREDRDKWNLLWLAAGDGNGEDRYTDAGDLAKSPDEHREISEGITAEIKKLQKQNEATGQVTIKFEDGHSTVYTVTTKPWGELRTLPWFEDRNENPYLLVTGQAGVPRQAGSFAEWVLVKEVPVLVEPLRKFITPVVYLLKPSSGPLNSFYFLLVIVWTLAVWALFGGAITRMASVQVARNEKISLREAVRFVWARYVSFLSAPLFPLLFVAFMVFLLSVYSLFYMIPWVGDVLVAGLGWPLVLLAGLIMALVLVGLVGWPMMYATISAEGSDSFDAISRSYSYVYQNPWSYAWYSLVALGYGAVVVFFVGLMGSLIVYLGKWSVSQLPSMVNATSREPSFLFAYAPTSFGWRTLLLEGAKVGGESVVQNGVINESAYRKYIGNDDNYRDKDEMGLGKTIGAVMVSAWLYLFFLMILGFGYSYFWSASTIIYLLMRRKVDDTDMDEVYMEDEDVEEPLTVSTGGAAPATTTGPVTMVEELKLRTSITTPANTSTAVTPPRTEPARTEPAPAPAPATTSTDGDKPAADERSAS